MFSVRFGALSPTGSIAIRQLRYSEYALLVVFRSLFGTDGRELTKIIAVGCNMEASRLKVASSAVFLQN